MATTSRNRDSDGWELAAEARTKINWNTENLPDKFTAIWEGFEDITDPNTEEVYKYANFRKDDEGFTVAAGYQLTQGLEGIPIGNEVQLTLLSVSKVAKGNMNNFRIQHRTPRA